MAACLLVFPLFEAFGKRPDCSSEGDPILSVRDVPKAMHRELVKSNLCIVELQ